MRSLVNGLFRTYIGRYQRALRQHYTEPEALQQRVLRHILAYQQETAFGIEHGFRHLLRSLGGFSERVPVRTYEKHLPYIERILTGETNVLSADRPDWIATTSGTTGSTKYLPYAFKAIRDMHLKGSWMSLACLYAKDPTVSVFGNRNLLIGGAYKGLHQTAGLPQGDISAIIIRNIPRIMQPFYIPDVELATAVSYEDKIERIAQLAAKEPGITTLGGVPTWNLPLYRRILELTGAEHMRQVWPAARVFKHGGVNFEPYRTQFKKLFPGEDFIFQEIYNATEGFFGVQDKDDQRDILLILNAGVYYEFVTWRDYQRQDFANAIPLVEVQLGEVYVMLITTIAGLYRYPMGDLVEFTHLRPFRLKILGRTQEFINAFGEDLLRSEAQNALLQACEAQGAEVTEYTVAPEYIGLDRAGRHHWVIEFSRQPADMERFNDDLDAALQRANYNYAAKRSNDFAISRHALTVVPMGFFRAWLTARGKQGGQHKVPRLANHREYLEELLARLPQKM